MAAPPPKGPASASRRPGPASPLLQGTVRPRLCCAFSPAPRRSSSGQMEPSLRLEGPSTYPPLPGLAIQGRTCPQPRGGGDGQGILPRTQFSRQEGAWPDAGRQAPAPRGVAPASTQEEAAPASRHQAEAGNEGPGATERREPLGDTLGVLDRALPEPYASHRELLLSNAPTEFRFVLIPLWVEFSVVCKLSPVRYIGPPDAES